MFIPFKNLEIILLSQLYNLEPRPKGLNDTLIEWWRNKLIEYECPVPDELINITLEEYPYGKTEEQYYTFPNILTKYVDFPNVVKEEYLATVNHPLAILTGLLQRASYITFFSWKKYFSNHYSYQERNNGFNWRGWWNVLDAVENHIGGLHLSISVPGHSLSSRLSFGGEDDALGVSLHLYLISFYVSIQFLSRKWAKIIRDIFNMEYLESYWLGFSFIEEYIFFYLFSPSCSGNKRMFTINWKDILLGKEQYSYKEIETLPIIVELSKEEIYEGTATIFESVWHRPRFNSEVVITKVELSVPKGIPIPGKGENDWDLEDRYIYSQTTVLKTTVKDSIEDFIHYIKDKRIRYGGNNWKHNVL